MRNRVEKRFRRRRWGKEYLRGQKGEGKEKRKEWTYGPTALILQARCLLPQTHTHT